MLPAGHFHLLLVFRKDTDLEHVGVCMCVVTCACIIVRVHVCEGALVCGHEYVEIRG